MPKYRTRRIAKKQRRIFYAKVGVFFVLFCLIIGFCSWLSYKEKININNIIVTGNSIIQTKDVLKIADELLLGNYLWLFPKRNILLYPKSKIESELLNSFLRIKAIDIEFADFQSININISERKPYALYCNRLEVESPNDLENHLALQVLSESLSAWSAKLEEKCYFMDENAFIFERAPNFPGDVYFKYFGDLIGVSAATDDEILGQVFLRPKQNLGEEQMRENQFEKVNLFIRFLKDINMDVYQLLVLKNGDYKLFFGNNSKLIFDKNQDLNEIFKNLRATLIDLGNLENKEFEYIDLRFNNKVLYKFKKQ